MLFPSGRNFRWPFGHRIVGVCARPIAIVVSSIVIIYFAFQPVFLPVAQFSREILPLETQTLTGVKGQTMLNPGEGLARIDIWLTTNVSDNGWIRVKFELRPDPNADSSYGSGIVVFRDSKKDWQISLRFQPDMVPAGKPFYLRTEAILSSSLDRLDYRYVQEDKYPFGNHHDLDKEILGQDLYFSQFRVTETPRPLAWVEAVWVRLEAAARFAQFNMTGALVISLSLLLVSAALVLVGSTYIAAEQISLPVNAISIITLILAITAVSLVIFLPGELPRANLVVGLQ